MILYLLLIAITVQDSAWLFTINMVRSKENHGKTT